MSRILVSGCTFAFGLVNLCHGFRTYMPFAQSQPMYHQLKTFIIVHDYSGLLAARFFLGVAEAGVFPGCFYLLSMWYKREEALRRFAVFFNSVTLAGAFGSLLASGIENMDGVQGHAGWRWIFILEGLATMIFGILTFFLLTDFPENARWLTAEEREFMRARIIAADDEEEPQQPTSIIGDFRHFFSDIKAYLGALLYFGMVTAACPLSQKFHIPTANIPSTGGNIVGYSITYFLPTIVRGFKYSTIGTQLHSVPPFAAAWAFSILVCFMAARARHALTFVLIPLFLALSGAGILFTVHSNVHLEYAAVFLVTMGLFAALPVALCWYVMNLQGHFERAVGTAWMICFGNIGGFVAVFSFPANDAPHFHTGYSVVVFGLCLTAAAAVAYAVACYRENQRSEPGKRLLI